MAPGPRTAMTLASKAEKEADIVMGTNNSSIASKRSVEMIYYPQPHFFRYFVKKPQRRSPIINRGYWLRMYAMAETVRQFVEKAPVDKPKFVLNLGCGYDPLPFILLSEEKRSAHNGHAVFVDIDYEKLMVQKKNAIRNSKEITTVLRDVEYGSDEDAIQLRSSRYIAVGCDLKNLKKLDDVLRSSILPENCSVLLLAEVSLTYMDVKSANEVVKWASRLSSDVQFCILEQFFPNGPDHPFAKTMMSHFNKLRAPLFSIHEFPSLTDQEQRFITAGWTEARARSLWDLWSDNDFLPEATRTGLDAFEAFDEWEEFALFASHYFLLIASNTPDPGKKPLKNSAGINGMDVKSISNQFVLKPHSPIGRSARRRYGALVPDSHDSVGHHGGQGEQTRLVTTDLYTRMNEVTEPIIPAPLRDIPTRMCHTITSLGGESDCLLIGGRTSPTAPLRDCWARQDQQWRQAHPLPEPRFRHSAVNVSVGDSFSSVLVYGGKTRNDILDSWLLWNESDAQGWRAVETTGANPEARFGACFARINENSGVLFGGIGRKGIIIEDFWTWKISCHDGDSVQVELTDLTSFVRAASPQLFQFLVRFGATVTTTSFGLVVAGGIMPRDLVPGEKEILLLDSNALLSSPTTQPYDTSLISVVGLGRTAPSQRPLLTGHVACALDTDQVLFLGGGAVCFSFGTFWTEGTWTLQPVDSTKTNAWAVVAPQKDVPSRPPQGPSSKPYQSSHSKDNGPTPIPRTHLESPAQFQQLVANGKPVIIEGSDIGPCTQLWTKDYLTSAVGEDRKVVVHAAESEQMNFQSKNFAYVTKSFGSFLNEIHAGGPQYLRSISLDQPSKLPAEFVRDFPGLQNDFRLPESMALVRENEHSSPLRISGAVTMWLHYDVMANVLCQIRGQRRLLLFPPDDIQSLHIPAGTSSSTIDIFERVGLDSPLSIPGTSPQEAILQPGEILFIPPLWSHTACSSGEVSVAVNVFFRNLSQGYAAGRDVYGNRDIQAYEKARLDLSRMARSFDGVPPDMARFYLRRLAQELQGIADQ